MATLKQWQDSREALQKEVASLVEAESELRMAIAAEKGAAVGPQSDSEVGNSQNQGSEQERALEYFVGEIDRIRKKVTEITAEIEKLLGVSKGGRRKTSRHRRKHRKTLRRK
jgi:prefoldin subunit 5